MHFNDRVMLNMCARRSWHNQDLRTVHFLVCRSDTPVMAMGFYFKHLQIITSLILCGGVAFAEGGAGAVGFVYGISVPDADNSNPHRIFGVKGLAFLTPQLSLGGYYLDSGKNEGTGARRFDYTLHGIEGAFHILNGAGDTFIALRVGSSKLHTEEAGTRLILSPYHYGLAAGYDYSVFSWLSFGFEGSFLHINSSSTTTNSVHYQEDSFGLMQFLGAIQFRL